MFKQTALTSVDSYKLGHATMYPAGTTKVYSNFTPRSVNHFKVPAKYKDDKIVFFGLQGFLLEMQALWDTTFFDLDFAEVEKEYASFVAPFCGPNGFDMSKLRELHDLGFLPIQVRALKEGTLVSPGTPVLTITNTEPQFYWLPNFLETWISSELWKSCTSATISYNYKKIIRRWAVETGGSIEFTPWQAHDFSVRGMSGIADAAKSGAGHLLSSLGTDNLPAVKYLQDCYKGKGTFIGGSVPATEHSVMCAGGKADELETFDRLITQYPSGVISIVSDTWDYWNVLSVTARKLKDKILARVPDALGLAKVVFRPDSGDPVKIICGDPYAPEGSNEYKGSVEVLAEIFGYTINAKGYKTLNQCVGLIYGDSITLERADHILRILAANGYASDNIVFGVGSYTFQYNTRDTLGFAMKATYVEINGEGQSIFKEPLTDSGTKKSARGLLAVMEDGTVKQNCTLEEANEGLLEVVFDEGFFYRTQSLEEIRNHLDSQ